MDLLKPFRKCVFCKERRGELSYVPREGIYGEQSLNWAYHLSCLMMVTCEPEKFSNRDIDMALEIQQLVDKWNKERTKETERILNKMDILKSDYCN